MGTRLAKIGGILQEVSGEELARQTGLEAPPTTPLGMQGLGATQDVAKMAGTGEQVRAVLRETLKERTDTRDVMGEAERGSTRGKFTVAQIQQQLQTLTGVGSLDNRVAEVVRNKITGGATPSFTNTINEAAIKNALQAAGFVGKGLDAKVEEVKKALTGLRDSTTKEGITAVLSSLGIKPDLTATASDLAGKLASLDVISQAGAQDIVKKFTETAEATKNIKVSDFVDSEGKSTLPFDVTAAAQVLGLKEDDLKKMTLGEVKAQLAAYRSETFSDLDELREALANPFSSQAQKDFARKRLAELGAVGVTSLEEKAGDIQTQMSEGDTVQVGNKQVKVEEIMSDQTLRLTVASALDSPDEMAKLEKTDEKLATWIKTNQKELKNVRGQLTAGLTEFAGKQKEKKDYLAKAPADLLDKLQPGWREASDANLADWKASAMKTSPTLFHALDKLQDPATAKGYDFALDALASLPVDTAKTFSTTVLDSIAANAGSGEEAKSLLRSYQDTENKDWQASIVEPAAPAFDVDFSQADYDAIVKPVLEQFAPGFGSVKALVDEINKLRVSANVADRQKAKDLSEQLANVKGQLDRALAPGKIEEVKTKNKTEKQRTAFGESFKFVNTGVENVINSLRGRGGDWLATRGGEVFADIRSKIRGLATDAQLGTIPFEEAKNQADALKGRMAGELAAFLYDENHLRKKPFAALDAIQILLDSGLKQAMNPEELAKLRSTLDKINAENTYKTLMGEPTRDTFTLVDRTQQLLNRI